jgi:hypothetical protein
MLSLAFCSGVLFIMIFNTRPLAAGLFIPKLIHMRIIAADQPRARGQACLPARAGEQRHSKVGKLETPSEIRKDSVV